MLAASAVAGACQKLDAGTAFQDDLLPPEGGADLLHIPPHPRTLKEGAHLLKGLGGSLLQVGSVDDRFVEQQHPGLGTSLHK